MKIQLSLSANGDHIGTLWCDEITVTNGVWFCTSRDVLGYTAIIHQDSVQINGKRWGS